MREKLLKKASDLKIIPSLNGTLNNAIRILGNSDISVNDLRDVIEHDIFLTAKIIGIANSAYYNRGAEIFSLSQAILNIGLQETKGIIICLLFIENIKKTISIRRKDLFDFCKHSLSVACSAKVLSEKTYAEDPQKAYISSMLHDIGKIIFYADVHNYHSLLQKANMNGNSLSEIEKDALGIDHQEIGYIIGKKWKMPEAICSVIKHHHKDTFTDKYKELIRITQLSNNFYRRPDYNINPEKLILLKVKDEIEQEINRYMEVISINS